MRILFKKSPRCSWNRVLQSGGTFLLIASSHVTAMRSLIGVTYRRLSARNDNVRIALGAIAQ